MQDSILKFQIDKYEVDDTDTAKKSKSFSNMSFVKVWKLLEFSILL